MQCKSSRRLVAMAAAVALGSAGLVLVTAPTAVATTDTFSNPAAITINDNANATPYPSSIAVAGVTAPISAVTVTLTGFSHGAMSDVGLVLVAPNGDAIALMDGVGAVAAVNNLDLTISDSAAAVFSSTTNPTTGSYKPASYHGTFDVFPAPGPGSAYQRPTTDGTATLTSVFGGDNANGTWSLFVRDFFADDTGSISGGWSISITTYANPGPISVPGEGAATPYPSTITVSGLTGVVTDVALTLPGITHANIRDLGAVLVGPTGQAFLVMDHIGGNVPVSNITLTFSDAAAALAPSGGTPVTGSYRPTSYVAGNSFPGPGPGLEYSSPAPAGGATFGSTFVGRAPNGTWSLYVVDFASPGSGSVSGGWSLELTTATPTGTTATPTLVATVPTSPSNLATIRVTGSAPAGSTVSLYDSASCSGGAMATGTAADLSGAGITVSVPVNQTTTLFARASTVGETTSACSSTSVTYTQATPPPPPVPDTTLTKTPGKKVKTAKRKAKVSFSFTSTPPGAGFECSIDGQAFAACASGLSLKAKTGRHTFAVRAVLGGRSDPTPATYAFTVRKKAAKH
jgi:subtilisin-like proprotein convertase family protein